MEPPATCIARQYRNQNYSQGESGTWKTDEVGEAAYGQTPHETGYAGTNATEPAWLDAVCAALHAMAANVSAVASNVSCGQKCAGACAHRAPCAEAPALGQAGRHNQHGNT